MRKRGKKSGKRGLDCMQGHPQQPKRGKKRVGKAAGLAVTSQNIIISSWTTQPTWGRHKEMTEETHTQRRDEKHKSQGCVSCHRGG